MNINNQEWKVKVTQSRPTLWDLMDYRQKERKWSCSVMSDSLPPHGQVACTRLLHPWDFLGKSTGVGCHFLLQGIFPTQGSNPGLLHCRQTLYIWATREVIMDYTVHGISQPRILECVAFPSPGDLPNPVSAQTQVSLIAGRCFTSWATREAQEYQSG